MKKRLSAFLMLFLLTLPSFSLSGETLRGYDSREGYQYVSFGAFCQQPGEEPQPILWRVLETDGEKA